MIIPICCFTCGAVVANKYVLYKLLLAECSPLEACSYLEVDRSCCRAILHNSIYFVDKLLEYDNTMTQSVTIISDENNSNKLE